MKQKWAMLILILAGIAAYGNTAKNGLFWDDDEFITRNAYIRSFRYLPQWFSQPMTAGAGVNSNYYRPLLQLSFAIDYKLWGLWPGGYHLENILWHAVAGILLYFFLKELLAPTVAFATALLWLVHPVHVEAVAYANSRGDSMATAFILLSLILWTKKRFWTSAAAFVLALLSKEFAIVTPGLIILLEFMKHQIPNTKSQTISKSQSQNSKQARQSGSLRNFQDDDKFRKLPTKLYRLLTIVVNLYNFTPHQKATDSCPWMEVQGRRPSVRDSAPHRNQWEAPDSCRRSFTKPISLHITIAVIYLILRLTVLNFQNTLNFYGSNPIRSNFCKPQRLDLCNPLELYAASLPARLMTFLKVLPIYGRILVWPNDLHMERTVEIPTAADQTVIISAAAVIVILLYCYIAVRKNRVIIPFAVGWFFVSILPVSGIIPISQILAEHFLYLPSIGFFLIVGLLIISGLNQISLLLKIGRLNDSNHLTFMYVTCWTILLIISIPLLLKTIRQNRIWRDPITFYEYTLAHAEPTARVYNNLAMAYADKKQHQKAIENYRAAIEMGDVYPNPHYNLGNTLMEIGKSDEAEKEYRRALEIDPNFHYATLKLGQMYLDQGKIDAAKKLVCPVFPTQPLCR